MGKSLTLLINAFGLCLCIFCELRNRFAFILPVLPSYSDLRFLKSVKAMSKQCLPFLTWGSMCPVSSASSPMELESWKCFVPVPSPQLKMGTLTASYSVVHREEMRRDDMLHVQHLKYKRLYLQGIVSGCVC